jgi:hypothetical protein
MREREREESFERGRRAFDEGRMCSPRLDPGHRPSPERDAVWSSGWRAREVEGGVR